MAGAKKNMAVFAGRHSVPVIHHPLHGSDLI
jgi:hypothetical protein